MRPLVDRVERQRSIAVVVAAVQGSVPVVSRFQRVQIVHVLGHVNQGLVLRSAAVVKQPSVVLPCWHRLGVQLVVVEGHWSLPLQDLWVGGYYERLWLSLRLAVL